MYMCVYVSIYIYTYLHATSISPSHPLVEPRPPIFDEVLFGVLDPVPVPEPALGPGRRQYTRAVQIHLEVLLSFLRDHIFRAPGTAALVLSQPGELRAELLRPLIFSCNSIFYTFIRRNQGLFSSIRKSRKYLLSHFL